MQPPGYLTSYAITIRGERCAVRAAQGDEEGTFTLLIGPERWPVDHPSDALRAAGPGEVVTADFGAFALAFWRDEDGRVRYRASAGDVVGPVDAGDERACWGLLARLGDERCPVACFFCRWSELEPSTGWGNLGCAIEHAERFDAIATSDDPHRRKYGPVGLLTMVDEWHACDRFEVRPVGYGYRGRPR